MSELLGANTDVLEQHAESLTTDARRVQDISALAQRAVVELQASWNGSDLTQLTRQWEQQVSPLLVQASASLETCAAQLRTQSADQRVASSDEVGRSPTAGTSLLAPAPPPALESPTDSATWWRSLSPLQQQQVIREHPSWIGNRDGVAFTARDLANRALLSVDRGFLVEGRQRLEATLAERWTGGEVNGHDAAGLARVKDKLASLDAIEATLARPGERQLLLLDLAQDRAEAAVANGNVETADNVAVFVPGMTTTVSSSLQGYDTEMSHLQQRAQVESKSVNESSPALAPAAARTATVTWIGYQTPMWPDLLNPDKSGTFIASAKRGAARLVPFLQGIGVSRDHDAHLTVLGHSYGSTTAGVALRQDTGVDDAVFFGSPGLGTNHIEDLLLAPGHTSYVEARLDPVGDLGTLGIDPSHLDGIRHLSARESTVVDPLTGQVRQLSEVTGHSSYLVDDSTSQYNASVIVAGMSARRVYDGGEGAGDLLSWPGAVAQR